ncbi:hypothetical protein ACJU26_09275 [Acidithiobacillus sp. M4-SHS-6]|uniref:hypothetical protein n=1 Tax=Acidithiobacillus sp. M4-SHS-6 TaxID=3383024 RepID=UPI0039BE3692
MIADKDLTRMHPVPVAWVPLFLCSVVLVPALLGLAGLAFFCSGHGIYWGFTRSVFFAGKDLSTFPIRELLRILFDVGDVSLLGLLVLAFWKGGWGMWVRLGVRCLTRQCRRFSAANESVPQALHALLPEISSWYRGFWDMQRGRKALFWGLFFLNWGVTICAVLFAMAAFIHPLTKPLLDATLVVLVLSSLAILWYWRKTRHFQRPDLRESAQSLLRNAGISVDDWQRLTGPCGANPRPYVSLFSIFVLTPIEWVGFPLGLGANTWFLFALAASSLALSLYFAAVRYWLFPPSVPEPIPLCCNLPLLEFSVAISGKSSLWRNPTNGNLCL